MEMLSALVLFCSVANIATCGYQNAERVVRVTGDVPDRITPRGQTTTIPNVQACQFKASAAASSQRANIPPGQVVRWQCVPKTEADAAGLR